jgi:molecular chaperone IbpA
MRVFDTSPLMRSAVGFDNLARLVDNVARANPNETSYPPYNIEKLGEDDHRITMAVAGFDKAELDIIVNDGTLVISGKASQPVDDAADTTIYLHRGIAKRAFQREFHLADTIRVTGASLENGLLHVELVREIPEERKPRQILINGDTAKTIDQKPN